MVIPAGVLCYPAQIKSLACWRKINRTGPAPSDWVLNIAGPFCLFRSAARQQPHRYVERISEMVSTAFRLPVRAWYGGAVEVRVLVPADVLEELRREIYRSATGSV